MGQVVRFHPVGFCNNGLHKKTDAFFRSKRKNTKLGIGSHNNQPEKEKKKQNKTEEKRKTSHLVVVVVDVRIRDEKGLVTKCAKKETNISTSIEQGC